MNMTKRTIDTCGHGQPSYRMSEPARLRESTEQSSCTQETTKRNGHSSDLASPESSQIPGTRYTKGSLLFQLLVHCCLATAHRMQMCISDGAKHRSETHATHARPLQMPCGQQAERM